MIEERCAPWCVRQFQSHVVRHKKTMASVLSHHLFLGGGLPDALPMVELYAHGAVRRWLFLVYCYLRSVRMSLNNLGLFMCA